MLIVKFTKYMYLKNSFLFKYRTRCLISFVCILFLVHIPFCPLQVLYLHLVLAFLFKIKSWIWIYKIQELLKTELTYPLRAPEDARLRPCNKGRQIRRSLTTTCASFHIRLSSSSQLSFFLQMFFDPFCFFFFWNLDTIHKNQYKSQQDIYILVSISLYFIQDHMSLNLLPSCL